MDDYGYSLVDISAWGDGLSVDTFAANVFLRWWVIAAIITLYGVRKIAKHYRKRSRIVS